MSSATKLLKPLRWGIMGAGHISNDWAVGLSTLNPTEHKIVAVSARNLESARVFAQEHGIGSAYGSYEELVHDPQIDVVYIGTIHSQHHKLGKLALNNGKHVLCEKPMCVNVKETQDLVDLARTKNLFLMEGIWTRFCPANVKLRELIESGEIGEVKQVMAGMGIAFDKNSRPWRWSKEFAGGTVIQFGTYTAQLATLAFRGLSPEKVLAGGHLTGDGVDGSSSATLIFPGGRTATLVTHSEVNIHSAEVIGTKGTLTVHFPFWGPTKLEGPNGTYEYSLPEKPRFENKINFWNTIGLCYECEEVRRCLVAGWTESPWMTLAETIVIAGIQEAIRKQIGVEYPTD